MKLLPLLCLLSPWFGPGSAQEISEKCDDVTVAEGDDALLPCSFKSKIEKFDWIKDKYMPDKRKEVFLVKKSSHDRNNQDPQFKDRVLFFKEELQAGNASIKIKRTRLEDSGNYTCVLFTPDRQEFNIRLNVDCVLTIREVTGAARRPYVKHVQVKNTWWLLECEAEGVPKLQVEWTNSANKTLTAKNVAEGEGEPRVKLLVNVTRSDNYTCVVTQKDICHQINNSLEVTISGKKNDPDYSTGFLITMAGISTVILPFL